MKYRFRQYIYRKILRLGLSWHAIPLERNNFRLWSWILQKQGDNVYEQLCV